MINKNYKTQMEAAKKGIFTEEMKVVCEKENVSKEYLMEKMAEGKIVIPANINHTSISPEGIGEGLRTKINVNLGVSKDAYNYCEELEKVDLSLKYGAHSIMDLSNVGKTNEFREELIKRSTAMIGTVPMYDVTGYLEKDLEKLTVDDFFDVVEHHAKAGVDFMTIHCGINRKAVSAFKESNRLTNIVSRGGSLTFAWMEMTGNENPFYEYYDRLLDILYEYDVTISLGDALRPGSIHDGTDISQIAELIELGKLTKRAWEKNVQVLVEGPGHVPINEIKTNIQLQKKLCFGAPFYVLGPIVTDVAPGYDHITSAIGGAIAASCGADFLCYVTPAEHLRLPTKEDVKEGIIASLIAAHAGDIGKRLPGATDWDDKMSDARRRLDWEEMFSLAIDEEKAREYFNSKPPESIHSCSMCGKMCAMNTTNKILKGEKVEIIED